MDNVLIDRACPLCDRLEFRPRLRKTELTLVRCAHCGMIYAKPIPQELASGEYYDRLSVPFYLSPDKLASDYAPVRFERELKLFRRYCQQGEVLDVGCSTGGFLHQLAARYGTDYQVFGTDVAGAALDYAARQGVRVFPGPFLEQDFGAQRFAAITFWAVMEHLAQPRLFLRKAAQLLRTGGLCFMLVPNMNSLAVRLLGPKYRYLMPDHVNYFTTTTLDRLAQTQPGLEKVAGGSSHFNPIVIVQDLRRGGRRVPDDERVRLLKRTTAYKQNPLLKPVKLLYSLVEGVLVRLRLADNIYGVYRQALAEKPPR